VHFIDPISRPEDPAPPLTEISVPADGRPNSIIDLLDALFVALFAACAFVVCGSIATGIFVFVHRGQALGRDALSKELSRNAFFQVPTELAAYVMLLAFMAFLVAARHKTGLFKAVSWNAPNRDRALYAIAGGILIAMFSGVAEFLLRRWIPTSLPIDEFFRDRSSAYLLAGFGILVAPLMEELVFRGFLYPALAHWTGAGPSVALCSASFALLHGAQLGYAWAPLLVLFVVGLALTVARAVTGSVAVSVVIHMAYNFALFTEIFIGTSGFRNLHG